MSEELAPLPKGGARRKKARKLPPVIEIDFTKDPVEALKALPCSEREQARHLGWYPDEVRSINRSLSIYDNIPMLCKGEECHWAKMCPTRNDYAFQGYRCPFEIRDAFIQFYGYVKELGVMPDDHTDLQMIADLVRLDLQIKRIDQILQIQGLEGTESGIVQSSGKTVVVKKAINPQAQLQCKYRDDRNKLYKELILSRSAKADDNRRKQTNETNFLTVLQMLRQAGEKTKIIEVQGKALPIPVEDVEEEEEDVDLFGSDEDE